MKKGFTIIEVSLVLAIAGLIFLMVFIALPALRSSQRDSDRREDMISFLDTVKKYQSNNRGTLPGAADSSNLKDGISVTWPIADSAGENSWAGFYKNYLGDDFVDPAGEHYGLRIIQCDATRADTECTNVDSSSWSYPNNYQMTVVLQAKCSGETVIATSNPRKIAILYKLEGAGVYCNNT